MEEFNPEMKLNKILSGLIVQKKPEEEKEEFYCSYCESKLTSKDSFCLFCGTSSAKVEFQEEFGEKKEEKIEEESEMQKVKKIAREILSAKKTVEEAEAELAEKLPKKQEELQDIELENARRATLTPPGTAIDLTPIQTEIATMTTSLEAKKDYYYLLAKKARRVYPQYFARKK